MNIGLLVSGLGHLFLLLWMFAAGFFTKIEKTPELQVTQVTILSTQEFDALNAGQPELPSTNTPDMARPAAELT
ncbi:MAG TPA: cell envelope biogenesis protein TolA, partial [Rhodobacter sp.]|nr:cell envelope biogenesis protein TolA [Rhodobacter sp.]